MFSCNYGIWLWFHRSLACKTFIGLIVGLNLIDTSFLSERANLSPSGHPHCRRQNQRRKQKCRYAAIFVWKFVVGPKKIWNKTITKLLIER